MSNPKVVILLIVPELFLFNNTSDWIQKVLQGAGAKGVGVNIGCRSEYWLGGERE